MRLVVVLLTMLASFLSLLAVIIVAKSFGFSPANFHDPDHVFDLLTFGTALAVMTVPILIVLAVHVFLLKGTLRQTTFGLAGESMLIGTAAGMSIKLAATGAAYFQSPSSRVTLAVQGVQFREWLPYFGWFIFALMLNSLSEELAYRVFPVLNLPRSKRLQSWGVVFGASVVFSLMHFLLEPPELFHFLYRLMFGVLAGGLFLRSRSLWLVVGLHSGWNFIALSISDGHWKTGALVSLTGLAKHSEVIANVLVLALAAFAVLCFDWKRGAVAGMERLRSGLPAETL